MRLIGLALSALLVAFQLWYTAAGAEQRALVPGWVRVGADQIARGIVNLTDDVTDTLGPRMRGGLRQTREALGFGSNDAAVPRARVEIGADLTEADRRAALLGEASLLGARLDRADFTKAYLRAAQLDGAHGEDALFDEAVLEGASLGATILPRASFVGADLTRADLRAARLSGARFEQAILVNADMTGAVLQAAHLDGARLAGTNLFRADLSGARLTGAIGLTQRQLDGACGDADTRLPEGFSLPPCLPSDL